MKNSIVGPRGRNLDILIGGPPCQPFSKSAFGILRALRSGGPKGEGLLISGC